ncbi:magnesium transporter [bacterium]|jgi:magnesium transporter|nr:magnesium transporter [bacterium]MBT3850634.1 magnesium transporter [bacterium]MBT4435059.1 magnesium transporter [bacterium]MDG2445700.1 magnesium transporter [Thermodesulfobacteriota bacterium]
MNVEIFEKISTALGEGKGFRIKEALSSLNPTEASNLIIRFNEQEICFILSSLDSSVSAEIILELPEDVRTKTLKELDNKSILSVLEGLESDDATDLISDLDDEKSKEILENMNPRDSSEVQALLQYEQDTAGGIMQTELVEVKNSSIIKDAINWIRLIANDVPDFYLIYVTNENDKLVGFVSLRNLILANPGYKIDSIMEPIEVSVNPDLDQEEVSLIFANYNIVSLPVVDQDNKLLGRITSDDVIDVIKEEAEEDIYSLAGVGEYNHPIYSSFVSKTRSRLPWLLVTLIGELIIAFIISTYFKTTLEKFILLAAFMPAVMATGGSVGIQTSAIVIRALGMGTINTSQAFKVILSELKLSLFLGAICGLIAGTFGFYITGDTYTGANFFTVIFFSLSSASVISAIFGAAFPLVLNKFNIDPANGSGPFVTMANDMFSAISYLLIALLFI